MQKHTPELIQSQLPFDEIPYGYCHCGCGQKTKLAPYTSTRIGWVRGEPTRFINNHHGRIKRTYPEGPNPSGLCMCGCGKLAPIATQTANRCGWVRGKPMKVIAGHHIQRPVSERFWEHVDRRGPDDCWLWTEYIYPKGYGRFTHNSEAFMSHRFAYILTHGMIPDGLFVLHTCDVRPCCNPSHLWAGTQQENVDDMLKKGRANPPKGEQHWNTILPDKSVVRMREMYATGDYTQIELGRIFGVSNRHVSDIVLRKKRKHV